MLCVAGSDMASGLSGIMSNPSCSQAITSMLLTNPYDISCVQDRLYPSKWDVIDDVFFAGQAVLLEKRTAPGAYQSGLVPNRLSVS